MTTEDITTKNKREEERMFYELMDDELKVDVKKPIPHPPIAISYGSHKYTTSSGTKTYDTPMCTYGNFSFIQAPPKHLKTYFVTLLVSALTFLLRQKNKWVYVWTFLNRGTCSSMQKLLLSMSMVMCLAKRRFASVPNQTLPKPMHSKV